MDLYPPPKKKRKTKSSSDELCDPAVSEHIVRAADGASLAAARRRLTIRGKFHREVPGGRCEYACGSLVVTVSHTHTFHPICLLLKKPCEFHVALT